MIDLNSHLPDPAANTSRTDLDAAMRSLASSITEISREAESSERSPRPRARRTMTLALATAACALLGLVGVSHLFGGGTGPTWAAADIAVAEKTPLLLLKAPGWSVKSFSQYETTNKSGGMTFVKRGMKEWVSLGWEPMGHRRSRGKQLASHATELPAITVDGHRARLFRQHSEGGGPMFTGHNAAWVSGKYLLILTNSYRGKPSKLEDDRFTELATQLKSVSADELLSSLPEDYLLPSKLAAATSEILADVPLPPGYSSETVLANLQASTHEMLAQRLITRAECGWIGRWVTARKHGHKAEMKRIANTLAPYKSWKYSRVTVDASGGKSWVGAGWIEALKKGGRMNFGGGDVRDIGKIYFDWMACEKI